MKAIKDQPTHTEEKKIRFHMGRDIFAASLLLVVALAVARYLLVL